MRKSNNGNPPTLVQQGRAARTTYGRWALDDAASEVMDNGSELGVPVPSELTETVSEERAAELLGVSLRSLRERRKRGTGPSIVWFLAEPRYSERAVSEWSRGRIRS